MKIVRIATLIVLAAMCQVAAAKEMSFSLEQRDLRPNLDLYQWIFADGDIVAGTAERFATFVKTHPELIQSATVILNSRGGSPLEGMQLGSLIAKFHFNTDVGVQGGAPMTRSPGQCMSACIYPYLGGDYRYLHKGSVIGIHQFRFSSNVDGSISTEVSQELSGHIVEYLKATRADPGLFSLMTETAPNDIHILTPMQLKKLHVVTGDVFSETWGFEVHGQMSYLKADQITVRGENKLLFYCDYSSHRPVMAALSQLPDRNDVLREARTVILIINDLTVPISQGMVVGLPEKAKGTYITWSIVLTPEIIRKVEAADTVGTGLAVSSTVFAGIKGVSVDGGREKLVRLIKDCTGSASADLPRQPGNVSISGASPAPTASSSISPEDAALAKRVANNFRNQLQKAGMDGMRESVESCYAIAKRKHDERVIKYCYVLDQLASAVDAGAMRYLKRSQDPYWLAAAALGRTMERLSGVKETPDAAEETIVEWEGVKQAAMADFDALLSESH